MTGTPSRPSRVPFVTRRRARAVVPWMMIRSPAVPEALHPLVPTVPLPGFQNGVDFRLHLLNLAIDPGLRLGPKFFDFEVPLAHDAVDFGRLLLAQIQLSAQHRHQPTRHFARALHQARPALAMHIIHASSPDDAAGDEDEQ